MRVNVRVAALLAVTLTATALPAAAQEASGDERILTFLSEVVVGPDASLEVRETIRARAAGFEIRHGIYRDFPTRYEGRDGGAHVVPFTVVSAERDGRPEPWHTAGESNGVRVYLGDRDTLVEPGDHTWVLTYRTDRQLGYFEDHDELFWNATGNGWVFPIDEVEARVTLPADPPTTARLEAYTGPQGSRERAYSASWEAASRTATFRATRGLGPREGLTVVVMWPKGVVPEPTRAERLRWRIGAQRSAIAAVLGLIAVLVYYLAVWIRVGRDPQRGVIVVAYDPPPGLTPAAMRYLKKTKFDSKTFAATIVQMAVQGHVAVEESKGSYTLRRTAPGREPLAPLETRIAAKLFGGQPSVALTQANHSRVGGAVSLLQSHLHTSIDKIYLLLNRGHLATGIGLSLVTVAVSVALEPLPRAVVGGFLSFWLLGWSVGVAVLLVIVVRAWRDAAAGAGSRLVAVPRAIFLTLFSIPFVGAEIFVLGMLAWQGSVAAALYLPALAGVNALFHVLLKAPTSSGRTLLDRIEGFERYLAATEADRINRMQGPQRTPALYEKLLPYAIALDLEERWSEQFSEVLAHAGEGGQTWAPGWYHGDFGAHGWSPAAFAGSVGGALGGAISSSSTAPGSRSGGGGGGSSGGGGGGGGGGGW
jgi:uncharacterized membrane protein YgcG